MESPVITITIHNIPPARTATADWEKLEDDITALLLKYSYIATVESGLTGNTTTTQSMAERIMAESPDMWE